MDALKVSMACILLKMTLDPACAHLVKVGVKVSGCPPCPQGYFVKQNCTTTDRKLIGTQCAMCTNCSAADQLTISECSTFADSLCGSVSTPVAISPWRSTEPEEVFSQDRRIHVTGMVLSGFFVLMLGSFLVLLSCRHRSHDNHEVLI